MQKSKLVALAGALILAPLVVGIVLLVVEYHSPFFERSKPLAEVQQPQSPPPTFSDKLQQAPLAAVPVQQNDPHQQPPTTPYLEKVDPHEPPRMLVVPAPNTGHIPGESDAQFYCRSGFAWMAQNNYESAIINFYESIRLDSKLSDAFRGRGEALSFNSHYDKAILDFNEAIRLNPNDSVALNDRGNAWVAKGDYDKAVDDYDKAVQINGMNADLYCNRGEAWYHKKMYDIAFESFRRALRIDPKSVRANVLMSMLRSSCPEKGYRNGEHAIESATLACELTKWTDPQVIYLLANAHAELGDFDKAIEWVNKAKALAPEGEKKDYDQDIESYKARRPYRSPD